MEEAETFLISEPVDRKTLVDGVSQRFVTTIDRPHRSRHTYYDTFDWSLYRNGLTLSRSAKEYTLYSLQKNEVVSTIPWHSDDPRSVLSALPDAALSDKLHKIMAIRALIPRCRVDKTTQSLSILDDLAKTVLRLCVETIRVGKTPVINVVTLRPVRGYRKSHRDISRFLGDYGTTRTAAEIFDMILGGVDEIPRLYPSDLHVRLQPEMPARDAMIAILSRLLDVIRTNEQGIKDDIDTECLHDFRVAVRRTRAALGQIKEIFPAASIAPLMDFFRNLARSSSEFRDLDVYLLSRDRYEAALPMEWRPRLTPLFELLATERTRCHREFSALLGSARYRRTLTEWERLLNASIEEAEAEPKNANEPIVKLARATIRKRYRRVMKLGRRIDDSTADRELHNLRLQCKKLRYLLEFFASLFPTEKMALLIRQLKTLQDNLGDFCDLSVQQPKLKTFIGLAGSQQEKSNEIAAATGGLIATLYRRQQEVRRDFGRTFREFSSPGNADLYIELFG